MASAISPAPNQATAPPLCSTPNLSTVGRSTGSQLRYCKIRFETYLKDWVDLFVINVFLKMSSSFVVPQMTKSLSVPLRENGTE